MSYVEAQCSIDSDVLLTCVSPFAAFESTMHSLVGHFSQLILVQALLILTTLNAVVQSSLTPPALGPLPNIQIRMHNQNTIDKLIRGKHDAPCNHEHSGASYIDRNPSIPKSFRFLNESVKVGSGVNDFQRASDLMFSFDEVNAMPWANVVLSTEETKKGVVVGTVLCTLIKCYKTVWTLNPCRICYINRHSDRLTPTTNTPLRKGVKMVDQIGYSTVEGHLISGEERFRVSLMQNDDVIFDISSFTKGAGAIGTLAMPFIRPIQGAFFRDVTLSMKKIMAEK